jgi:hypothetical protein
MLLKLFNLADKDGSGMLTADELVPIVRGVVRPGIPVTTQHSHMLMKMLDKDGDGTITIDEFLEGAKRFNWNPDVLSDLITQAQRPLAASAEYSQDIEIVYSDITLGQQIGEGTFGQVFKGLWRGSPVAVKTLKMQILPDRVLQEFRKELQILAYVRNGGERERETRRGEEKVLFLACCFNVPPLLFYSFPFPCAASYAIRI